MKRALPIVILLFVLVGSAFSQASSKDEKAVHEIEDAIAVATDKNDADVLDKLWASDYVFVNPAGIVMTKADRLTLFRSGRLKLESYSRDEENIRIYGKVAIVVYRSSVKGQREGLDITSRRRVTTVLEKRHGHWLIISQQSTPIVIAR
jgi:ketosteroid isomerase-like protein